MILVVTGPTGVGKTKLSIALALQFDAWIINGDSMQVYRGLDIATAKIKEKEKKGIPHFLFDIVNVDYVYTAYDYQRDCRRIIEDANQSGKNVIIVGGTGLYIKSALYDYRFTEEKNKYDFSQMTNEELLAEIKKNDPNVDIHVHNRRRLERRMTQYLNNSCLDDNGNHKLYDFTVIGLTMPKEQLYERINNRVDAMMDEGLLIEAKTLYDQNIKTKAVMTGIGYKELFQYFDGNITLNEAIDQLKKNSRHYAKRQYTFFRNQMDVNWFEVNLNHFDETVNEVYRFITEEG